MKLLGRAGRRRVYIDRKSGGHSGRCACPECAIEVDRQTQRTREKRAWRREVAGA